ncbi:uncharacterized protein LOC127720327 [Mytilus californianus]|uniref:uncharacterized protein LOC127720327 n=1 Tax=Mytilus californianus TaxID=6549 RepID=UPI0022454D66|nr:uncharacterized protein LOC127720327 [Mytilus californianus]
MARSRRPSSSESEDERNYEEIMKLFASEDEFDASFSGFSENISVNHASNTPECIQVLDKPDIDSISQTVSTNVKTNKKTVVVPTEKGPGKGPGKNKKGKAPLKRSIQITQDEPSASCSKPKAPRKTSKSKQAQAEQNELLKQLFADLSSNIVSAINVNSSGTAGPSSDSHSFIQELEDNDINEVENDQNVFNLFETDDLSEHESNVDPTQLVVESEDEEFDYEMPKIFEDDERFDSEVSPSIASVIEKICKKKSDVTSLTKDSKIPSNCKALVPPPVNPEIWQFLARRAKTEDLISQNIQKLTGAGMVPLIKVAELLRGKNPCIKTMRELISRAISIQCNLHFELSIKRRMNLKPHIERKFHQLCNRNEVVGEKLFGDDISKRLREINDVQKINKTFSSKNYRGRSYRRGYRFGMSNPRGNFRGQSRYPRGSYRQPMMNSQYRRKN